MAYEVVLKGAALTFAVRDEDVEIAKALCGEITNTVKGANVQYCLISQLEGDIDVLINATPLGMSPKTEIQPVSDKVIFRCKSVFDAVYNPLETVLIQKALSNGSRAVGGMAMLVWQAVVAHEKWDNSTYDVKDIEKICIDASKELENK